MATYIIDIDGTIADIEHRRHWLEQKPKNWVKFFEGMADDKPIEHMRQLLDTLNQYWVTFVYCSGRPEKYREDTLNWLDQHDFPMGAIYMRKDGDYRDDAIVKRELLDLMRVDGFKPDMAFDDRDRVVRMWRDNGIPCAQVAEGDF